ncbi:MAG: GAF domain-containing protein [Acidimicrobiia bacterium]|nr:GAF domain-containing protein [Acidimicrobiia bacterium]
MTSRLDNRDIFELMSAATAIVEASDLEAILDELVATAVTTTGARYGALGVIGGHGTLSEFHHLGMDQGAVARIGHLPIGRGLLGTVIRTGEPLRLDEITEHPDSAGFPRGHPPMGSFLGVPVKAADQIYGNLYLTDKPGGFNAADQSLVEGLAILAGSAINTAKLNERINELAIVGERERIARDIHDSIIQDLFGLGLGLQGLAMRIDARAAHELNATVDKLDDVITQLRSLIFDLSHPGRIQETAHGSMKRLLDRISEPYDATVTLNMTVEELPESTFTDDLRHVVQESVSNALRHSGAKRVTVDIDAFGDCLVMAITDDGDGFDPDSVVRGLGLGNLEARVHRLDGELAIRSKHGKGTVVEARIPLGSDPS